MNVKETQLLWEEGNAHIYLDAENSFIIWHPTGYLNAQEFRAFADKYVEEALRLAPQHPNLCILGDNRLTEAVDEETTTYITTTIFTNLKDVIKKQALILPESVFAEIAVADYADSEQAEASGLPTQMFQHLEDAIAWLKA